MRRLLLTVCAIFAAAIPELEPVLAQAPAGAPSGPSPTAPSPTGQPSAMPPPAQPAAVPPARLIRPRQNKGELRAWERQRQRPGPVDERCRPLKLQLEGELAHPVNPHKAFQARLARNAGTRLCRDGQVEKGMAEFRKGLSYLEETHQP